MDWAMGKPEDVVPSESSATLVEEVTQQDKHKNHCTCQRPNKNVQPEGPGGRRYRSVAVMSEATDMMHGVSMSLPKDLNVPSHLKATSSPSAETYDRRETRRLPRRRDTPDAVERASGMMGVEKVDDAVSTSSPSTETYDRRETRPLPRRRDTAVTAPAPMHPVLTIPFPNNNFHKAKFSALQATLVAETFRAAQSGRRSAGLPAPPDVPLGVSKSELKFRRSMLKMQEHYLLLAGWHQFEFGPTRMRQHCEALLAPGSPHLKRKRPHGDSDNDEPDSDSGIDTVDEPVYALHADKRRRINPYDIPSQTLLRSVCEYYADDVCGLVNILRVLDVLMKMGYSFVKEGSDQLHSPPTAESSTSTSGDGATSFSYREFTERLYEVLTVYEKTDLLLFRMRPELDPHLAKRLRRSEEAEVKNFFKTGCGVAPAQVIKWYYSFTDAFPTWEACLAEFFGSIHQGPEPFAQFLKDLYAQFSFVPLSDAKDGPHYMVPIGHNEAIISDEDIVASINQDAWSQTKPLTQSKATCERLYTLVLLNGSDFISMNRDRGEVVTLISTHLRGLLALQDEEVTKHRLFPVTLEAEDIVTRSSRHPFDTNIEDTSYSYANLPRIIPPPRSINRQEIVAFFRQVMSKNLKKPNNGAITAQEVRKEFIYPYNGLLEKSKAAELLGQLMIEVCEEVTDWSYALRQGPIHTKTPLLPNLDYLSLIHYIVDQGYPTVRECIEYFAPRDMDEARLLREMLDVLCVVEHDAVIPRMPAFIEACQGTAFVKEARDGKFGGSGNKKYCLTYSGCVARMTLNYRDWKATKPVRKDKKRKQISSELRKSLALPRGAITTNVDENTLRDLGAKLRRDPVKPSGLRFGFTPDTAIMN